jgi:hypothetical protein
MLRNWFHAFESRQSRTQRSEHGPRTAHKRRAITGFEQLEGRQLLSTFTVTNLTDVGQGAGTSGDLRYCIIKADSAPNSTIQFGVGVTGTIHALSPLPRLTANMSINGPGASSLTVNYGGKGAASVFNVAAGATVTLSGLTVTGGTGTTVLGQPYGGDVANFGTLTVNKCIVCGGSAYGGGGIASSGTLTLNQSTVSGNTAVTGGGIENLGQMTLNSSNVSGNSAAIKFTNVALLNGGGIENNGSLTVSTCNITGNTAQNNGGGIDNSGTLTVVNSTLSSNNAGTGGGISNARFYSATILASTLNANTAANGGGVANAGPLTAFDSTFSGDSATSGGGGAYVGGIATLINDTFTLNTITVASIAPAGGGVLVTPNGLLTLENTIVAGNLRACVTSTTRDDVAGAVSRLSSSNLIGDGLGMTGITNGVNGNQVGSSTKPIDPKLGPLANNGGPTLTHALLAGSPAIDAGNNFDAFPVLYFVTDQRGKPRVVDGGIGHAQVDIGAYEYVGAN